MKLSDIFPDRPSIYSADKENFLKYREVNGAVLAHLSTPIGTLALVQGARKCFAFYAVPEDTLFRRLYSMHYRQHAMDLRQTVKILAAHGTIVDAKGFQRIYDAEVVKALGDGDAHG